MLLYITSRTAFGQIHPKINAFNVGFTISQYQKDFGIGVHIISPYFAKSKVAIRFGGNLQWLEYQNGSETTWTPYKNFQLGARYRQFVFDDILSIYSEGGLLLVVPNAKFSTKNSLIGGYGLLGFAFKPIHSSEYFIELGGVGTGATADKIIGRPVYSNGFLMNVGFRVNL